MKVNIVTVNYNNSMHTINMLSSLSESRSFIEHVLIIDNASSNEELAILSAINKKDYGFHIDIVKLQKNIGYFPGLNVGLDLLGNVKRKYLNIVCNNDLLFDTDFFSKLNSLSFKSDVLAIAPSIITADSVYQNPAQINKPSLFKRAFYNIYYANYILGSVIFKVWSLLGLSAQSKKEKDNNAKGIYIGMGAIYILLPQFFYKNDRLAYPESLFLYGEEAFLSKQIEDAHGILWYEPELEVVHLESVATSKLPSRDKYNLMKKAHSIYRCYFK